MSLFKRKIFSGKKGMQVEVRLLQFALFVLIGLLLAGGVVAWQIHKDEMRRTELREQAMHPASSALGGPFTLTDQSGKTVTDFDYRGKYLLVYFGYTYCPDLCPTGLEAIAHTLDQLGRDAKKIQTIFITIDPARDTPKKLKEYVASFHPGIEGLTGSPDQIATIAKEYQVYYARGEDVEDGDYLMDHSSLIYVMDPKGKFVTTFPDDVSPAAMTDALRSIIGVPKPAQSKHAPPKAVEPSDSDNNND